MPDGIRVKIERAQKHVNDLERRVLAFNEANRDVFVIEDDAQTGERIVRMKFSSPLADDIPAIIGDAVHNIRTTLDHLICQLALKAGATDLKPFSFPIYDSPPKDETQFARKVQGIDPAAIELIKALQPYNGGPRALWVLSELDNFDKHRLPVVAAIRFGGFMLHVSDRHLKAVQERTGKPAGVSFRIAAAPPDGSTAPVFLQDGDELGRLLPSDGLEHHAKVGCAFAIAFREPRIVEGEAVLPLLVQLGELTESILNQFAPLL